MNKQRQQKCAAIFIVPFLALLLSVGQVQAQDKKIVPSTPDGKDAKTQVKKDASTTPDGKEVKTQDKKDSPEKTPGNEKVKVNPHSHDHKHDAKEVTGFAKFLKDHGTTIQIVASVHLIGGIAFFIILRRAKGRNNKVSPPPAPDKPQEAK